MRYLRVIMVLVLLGVTSMAQASDKKLIKGFSGGMMVHTGYQFGGDNPYNINVNSPTFGLGGCAKLHFSDHFRAGFEGYFSSADVYEGVQSGSHNKLFWTGALADFFWKVGKLVPYVGATVGGGVETSFYMFEGNKYDWSLDVSVLHKQPFFAFDPYVGVEYKVGRALRLTLKADFLLAINSDGLNRPMGPRLYFGVIFAH